MLHIKDGQKLPAFKYSKVKVLCYCDCGNPEEIMVRYNTFSRGKPTCGKCALWNWKIRGSKKYGRLSLLTPLNEVKTIGRQKLLWRCDCGSEFFSPLSRVISGNTQSCGCLYKEMEGPVRNHTKRTKSEWLSVTPGLLDDNLPDEWSYGARIKPKFLCKCGNTYSMTFWAYKPGISNCRNCCGKIFNSSVYYGSLCYDDLETSINPKSNVEKYFRCNKCGVRDKYKIRSLELGQRKKCGHCNRISLKAGDVYGKLTIKSDLDTNKYSTHVIKLKCDCGNEFDCTVSNVMSGNTNKCGHCRLVVFDWYKTHENLILSLKCPIDVYKIPPGGIIVKGSINTTKKSFLAQCFTCGADYRPRWEDVRLGKSLTCGCTSNRISAPVKEIEKYLTDLNINVTLEYKINGLIYDLYLPDHKLLIELNGLRWHSMDGSKLRDLRKYENASSYKYMSIYEDEWKYKKEIICDLILNKIGLNHLNAVRSSKSRVDQISAKIADEFLDKFHYIGRSNSGVNYGCFINNDLVAVCSFKRPTRQSHYEWELVRMASHRDIRVHGIWSKILKIFISDKKPSSIVSFSDNRLFSGLVYEKLGFMRDGDVRPDYYWIKGDKRYHKSTLRKKPGEVGTETELRTAQGMRKIYDLGKVRWVLNP